MRGVLSHAGASNPERNDGFWWIIMDDSGVCIYIYIVVHMVINGYYPPVMTVMVCY